MSAENLDTDTWRKRAAEYQEEHAKYLGNKRYASTKKLLKDRIAFVIFGPPAVIEDMNKKYENYSLDQKKIVDSLTDCISANQDDDNIFVSFILIYGRLNDGHCFLQYIFRVPGNKFIDYNCRIYKSWKDFEENNKLPEAMICYPGNGEYEFLKEKLFLVYSETPEAREETKLMKTADAGCTVASVGAGLVIGASLFVPIAGPLLWASYGTTIATAGFAVRRSAAVLADRSEHGQSIGIEDPEARAAWLRMGTSISSLASAGATAYTNRLASTHGLPTETSVIAISIANGLYVFSSACQVVDNIVNLVQKKEISKMNLFQFMGSLLVFCNASVSAYQAYVILDTLSAGKQENLFEFLKELAEKAIGRIFSESSSTALPTLQVVRNFIGIAPNGASLCILVYDYIVKNFKKLVSSVKEYLIELYTWAEEVWKVFEKEMNENLLELLCHVYKHISSKEFSNCFNFSEKLKIKDTLDRYPGCETKIMTAVLRKAKDKGITDLQEFKEVILFIVESIEAKVAVKEMDFQKKATNALELGMTEKQLEQICGIQGDRSQHFFEECMRELPDDSDKFWKLSLEEIKERKKGKVDVRDMVFVAKEAEGSVEVKAFSDLPTLKESDLSRNMNPSKILRCRLMQLLKTFVGDFEIDTERMNDKQSSVTFIVQFKGHNMYQTAFVKAVCEDSSWSGLVGLVASPDNHSQ